MSATAGINIIINDRIINKISYNERILSSGHALRFINYKNTNITRHFTSFSFTHF